MNDAFSAFLHALPTLLGCGVLVVCLYGFWRGLGLRPKDLGERAPDPLSPAEAIMDRFASPPVWPRWIKWLFGR